MQLYIYIYIYIINKISQIRDNYTLPTCGLPLIWCVYPWFKFWYFTHLWFPPLLCRNPSLPSRYSNIEYLKNKSPNRSKHSHSNLEHEEHTKKSEKLQEVEPKYNIQHSSNPWADQPARKTKGKRRKEYKIKTRYFKPRYMNLAQIKFFSNLEHKHSWPIDVSLSPPHSVTHYISKPLVCPKITSKHHKFSYQVNWSNTQHTQKKRPFFSFIWL